MKKGNKSKAANLRQKAEELLIKKSLKTDSQLSETDILKLIHEFEVHKIELEMQNEELKLANEQEKLAKEKYTELYQFAPSGYFTLSKEGEIIKSNICGSQMLGKERHRLKFSRFGFFVSNDTKPIFNLFLEKVFSSKAKESCEVTMSTDGNLPIYVYLIGIASENGEQCLVNMIDITERMYTEAILRESEERLEFYIENPPMAVIEWDSNFKVIRWTGDSEKMFGLSAEETIGKPIMDLDIIFEPDIPIVQNTIEKLTNGLNKQVFSTNRNYRKD